MRCSYTKAGIKREKGGKRKQKKKKIANFRDMKANKKRKVEMSRVGNKVTGTI